MSASAAIGIPGFLNKTGGLDVSYSNISNGSEKLKTIVRNPGLFSILPFWRRTHPAEVPERNVDLEMLFGFGKPGRIFARNIAAIVFDFDGVFTDNKVTVTEDGKEAVICNRADGLGIKMLRAQNIPLLIISSETNPVVRMRGVKLGLDVLGGIDNKQEALSAYCAARRIDLKKVIYVGNDLNDFAAMKSVGYPVAPRDAHPKIRRLAKYIINKNGGEGVVKELAENIIV